MDDDSVVGQESNHIVLLDDYENNDKISFSSPRKVLFILTKAQWGTRPIDRSSDRISVFRHKYPQTSLTRVTCKQKLVNIGDDRNVRSDEVRGILLAGLRDRKEFEEVIPNEVNYAIFF